MRHCVRFPLMNLRSLNAYWWVICLLHQTTIHKLSRCGFFVQNAAAETKRPEMFITQKRLFLLDAFAQFTS